MFENTSIWLPFLAAGIGVPLLIWLENRSGERGLVVWGPIPIAIFLVGTLFAGILFYYGVLINDPADGKDDALWLKVFLILFLIGCIYCSIDTLQRRIEWNERGFSVRRAFGRSVNAEWHELNKVNYNWLAQWWSIQLADGRRFVVYEMMRGSDYFLTEARSRLETHT
ncbi:MAG: hypothetical protein AAFX86_08735 [Pseudomonadota bacterium]